MVEDVFYLDVFRRKSTHATHSEKPLLQVEVLHGFVTLGKTLKVSGG